MRPLEGITVVDFEYRMDAIPDVGEHTDGILRELGYADGDIANLRDTGAI